MADAPIVTLMRDEVWGSNDGKRWAPVSQHDDPRQWKYLKLAAQPEHGIIYCIAIPNWVRDTKRGSDV